MFYKFPNMPLVSFNNSHYYYWAVIRPKNNTFVSGNAGDEKNLNRGGRKKCFFINLIEVFKQSLDLKNYSNSNFLCWKTKSPIFYFLKGKKRKFVRINLLVEIFLFVCVFSWNKNIYSHMHWLMRAGRW